MAFSEIIGQDRAVEILRNALKKKRIAGAYLFDGPSGSGKRFAALNFAKALNCQKPKNGVDACDKCASCRKIQDRNHIDISWIEPDAKSNVIKIDQVRQLQGQINLKPYEANYKVFCVLDADTMTQEAQNALLKTLEEPPVKSVIILTSSNSGRFFRTIISRCQPVKFSNLSLEAMSAILKKAWGITNDAACYFAFLSQSDSSWAEGCDKDSIKDMLVFKNQIIDDFLAFLKDQSREPALLKEKKEAILQALGIILWWFRDLLVIKERGAKAGPVANRDRIKQLKLQASSYSTPFITNVIKAVLNAISAINTRCNPKLALSLMLSEALKTEGRHHE